MEGCWELNNVAYRMAPENTYLYKKNPKKRHCPHTSSDWKLKGNELFKLYLSI